MENQPKRYTTESFLRSIAVVVIVASSVVIGMSKQNSFLVSAATLANGVLTIVGGEKLIINCTGSSLALTQTGNQATADCRVAVPTATRVPSPTSFPSATVVNFDNGVTPGQGLNGQYPQGLLDWGTGRWMVSGPWEGFTTNSTSFSGGGITQATINVLQTNRVLSSLQMTNGASTTASVTLTCAGNPNVTKSVGSRQVVGVTTNWTTYCDRVTISTTAGWDINFDNLTFTQTGNSGGTTTAPTPTPRPGTTSTPSSPTPTMQPMGGPISGDESMALNAWGTKNQPIARYDKCDDGTSIIAAHKTYYVIGPDGKKYPTWHPATDKNPITGVGNCYYGHEHGRNPREYANFAELQRHFGRDVNSDGQINDADRAGIPFGYVNEQMMLALGSSARHEDHVGHKIEFANNENDRGAEGNIDSLESGTTAGVIVPVKQCADSNCNPKWKPSGIRCQHFHKIHQGVTSSDAFGNNLHELFIQAKCTSTRSDYPSNTNTIAAAMLAFGAPGEFTRFCGNDRTTIISIGKTAENASWPGSRANGMRNITTRDCIGGQNSIAGNYEIWDGEFTLYKQNGSVMLRFGGAWEVLDSIRYYYPGQPNNLGYMADLCNEKIGGQNRTGIACDIQTNYGTRAVSWDDRNSYFKGISRGQYVDMPQTIENAGGSNFVYTDWFGRNASTTPFVGSIKQMIPTVNAQANFSKDPRIIQRVHNSYGNTVHAPN